jgi:hypothetical protein
MKQIFILAMVVFILSPGFCQAKRLHKEKWYQQRDCTGQTEVIMGDKTRCDCVTSTHAIEFDFGNKWGEAIGQSLNYGLQTGKKPGIYLIIEKPEDYKYWIRLNSIIEHYKLPIDTWKVSP